MVLLLTCIANIKKILRQRNLIGPKTVASTSVFDISEENRMVDLCSRHPRSRAVRAGNPDRGEVEG